MKRLGLLVVVLLIIPQAAVAQVRRMPMGTTTSMKTRDFLRMEGASGSVPAAQITFRHSEENQLCTLLGIKRGPQALNKNFFLFERITIHEGDSESERMELKFPKKPKEKDEFFTLWESCVPSDALRKEEDDDLIVVNVRRPRYKPTKLWIGYPPIGTPFAMNISRASDGQLIAQIYAVAKEESTPRSEPDGRK